MPELLERKRRIDAHTAIATALLEQIKTRQLDFFFDYEERILARQTLVCLHAPARFVSPLALMRVRALCRSGQCSTSFAIRLSARRRISCAYSSCTISPAEMMRVTRMCARYVVRHARPSPAARRRTPGPYRVIDAQFEAALVAAGADMAPVAYVKRLHQLHRMLSTAPAALGGAASAAAGLGGGGGMLARMSNFKDINRVRAALAAGSYRAHPLTTAGAVGSLAGQRAFQAGSPNPPAEPPGAAGHADCGIALHGP